MGVYTQCTSCAISREKRQRDENKYPDESVLGNGKIRDKFPINYTVAYPGEKVGSKRELGDFVNQFGAPGGQSP